MQNKVLLDDLIDAYSDASVFHLKDKLVAICNKHNISANELEQYGYISRTGGNYYINFNNNAIYVAKLHFDLRRLKRLNSDEYHEILYVAQKMLNHQNTIKTIFLVGSFARNTASRDSDYDFLVISAKDDAIEPPRDAIRRDIDVIQYSVESFSTAISNKDEFIFWALKYGLLIHDDMYIHSFFPQEDVSLEELYLRKLDQVESLQYRARLSFGTGRIKDISKRVHKFCNQVVRLSIIQQGMIPKSSKEIQFQSRNISASKLPHLITCDEALRCDTEERLLEIYNMTSDRLHILRRQ